MTIDFVSDTTAARRYIWLLYTTLLGREPDADGEEKFVKSITNVESCVQVFDLFLASDEYKGLNRERLFVPPGHFYSPIVSSKDAQQFFSKFVTELTPESLVGVNFDRKHILSMWYMLLPHMISAPFPVEKTFSFRYFFNNPAFGYADGSLLHAVLRHFEPRKIIEIGSGYSSANIVDTLERFPVEGVEVTFIDPYPELLIDLLDPKPTIQYRIIGERVQDVDVACFESLNRGDLLFIDSTHVLRTGSDVCFELFEILPRLKAGVIVHFHDVFWPFEYPEDWVANQGRSWNEIYALRAFLTNNEDWRIIMFGDFMAKMERDVVLETYPRFFLNTGGSIWLEKLC